VACGISGVGWVTWVYSGNNKGRPSGAASTRPI
jgi:hypothetical protein